MERILERILAMNIISMGMIRMGMIRMGMICMDIPYKVVAGLYLQLTNVDHHLVLIPEVDVGLVVTASIQIVTVDSISERIPIAYIDHTMAMAP